jgi:hypothetical protein
MFPESFFEKLPPYFGQIDKDRLVESLKQFHEENTNLISYDDFFINSDCDYLMQSDFIQPLQGVIWKDENTGFETNYMPAILLSNTCDLSDDNERGINVKNALFAPVVGLTKYVNTLKECGKEDSQINGFINTIKRQGFSNLIYLPPYDSQKENIGYIVFLDKVFYRPTNSLKPIFEDLPNRRIRSLSHFGFYLFLLKTINHFGRIPEELEKRSA